MAANGPPTLGSSRRKDRPAGGGGLGARRGAKKIAATALLGATVTLLGFRIPRIWLLRRISARQNEIRASLPDALDLITVSAEADLAFEAALARPAPG